MSELTNQLNLSDVQRVVQHFYMKAQHHPVIAHFFDSIEHFQSHEQRITAFWWLALGGTTKELPYDTPSFDMINKHLALGIQDSDLEIWIALFEQTLFEELNMDLASSWQLKVHEIARHLKALVIDGKTGGIRIEESRESLVKAQVLEYGLWTDD